MVLQYKNIYRTLTVYHNILEEYYTTNTNSTSYTIYNVSSSNNITLICESYSAATFFHVYGFVNVYYMSNETC